MACPSPWLSFVHTFENLRSGLTGVLFPLVVAAINAQLNPYSEEYFRRTREVFLGQRLEDLRPPGPQREQALEELRGQLDALSKHLDRNGEGKVFVMGDTVSFADFVLGGSLSCAKLMLPAEEWQAVESWNGGRWGKHVEAMRAYAAIDEGEIWRREA